MYSGMNRFRRYQLSKTTESVLNSGHPWILNGKLSTAISAFQDGDWMKLVSGSNETLGFGIYSSSGPIGIRIIQRGNDFSIPKLLQTIERSLELRKPLRAKTNAYRLIHGENDLIPGVTVDRYGSTWVVQTYSRSLRTFSRLVVRLLYSVAYKTEEPIPKRIVWISPQRIGSEKSLPIRFLRGKEEVPYEEKIFLDQVQWKTKIPGQKGGFFLDVRNLRQYILEKPEIARDRDCLHLFSHTGLTSVCLEVAGAKSVFSADGAKEALEEFVSHILPEEEFLNFEKKNTILTKGKHHLVRADLFQDWGFLEGKKFSLIVLDPPNLTPNQASVPAGKKAYRSLISKAISFLEPGGDLILLSCSGRILESEFEKIGRETLANKGWKYKDLFKLRPEPDHPTRKEFPEGKYFKVHIYKKCEPLDQ
ncbi:S-adenosylmethionine-dependent methyltransferase domain protein [Leptospira licerasiae serovar Varillal str. VAR 010]|uniref:S-adenosylmethionine-dependent methyltransferase domain protein n=2 Tax=Leptospira licerasiae TaxID=447106 RepID=A0ABN0H830_9LEPT|nr:S-adenosylmethionine-dependent methyltransferase domain protein [Leptospira licerasiae serovar Varillal str. VAR 010]EJZ41921.1 S-adenosylmethionine-dependent methyltransferase domain protein [Leptospira licerasiae str. MMD4847]